MVPGEYSGAGSDMKTFLDPSERGTFGCMVYSSFLPTPHKQPLAHFIIFQFPQNSGSIHDRTTSVPPPIAEHDQKDRRTSLRGCTHFEVMLIQIIFVHHLAYAA